MRPSSCHTPRKRSHIRASRSTAQSSTSNWADVARNAGAKVEAVEGFVQAVQLLKDGRVDATVNDTLAVGEYQKTTGDTGVKVAGTTGDTSEQAFAARKDSGFNTLANFNKQFLKVKQVTPSRYRKDFMQRL